MLAFLLGGCGEIAPFDAGDFGVRRRPHVLVEEADEAEWRHRLPGPDAEALAVHVIAVYGIKAFAAHVHDLHFRDPDQRLAALPAHYLAAERQPVAGSQEGPAEPASHGLATGTDRILGQGNGQQAA